MGLTNFYQKNKALFMNYICDDEKSIFLLFKEEPFALDSRRMRK